MDDVEVPYRTFEYLLTGFVHGEAVDAGQRYTGGNVAHPGDPFGDVFGWLWDNWRDTAVSSFAQLLATARDNAPDGVELRMDALIKGLQFALHRSRLSDAGEFDDVERTLRAKMPEHFGGRTDL
ncbi:hypothetical protein EJ357_22625 [Streptomyces cyaneochromogenes]|uniref:Uncharacterized protein n=1 Tax=Streptomyces cyaneochromogenes TaxID=2496836 RepID=A0A3Q9EUG0_9ACTN|nr:hypothetical protein [Streptomyces cyaneochromogenes]AZQ35928.1 hypothetical protein EJ357_22625 [Streptomyces cyaneochromogenes]